MDSFTLTVDLMGFMAFPLVRLIVVDTMKNELNRNKGCNEFWMPFAANTARNYGNQPKTQQSKTKRFFSAKLKSVYIK